MITYEEALAATNPNDSDEKRDQSARTLMAGSIANDVYWNHRSDLEALQARADGHGVVTAPPSEEGDSPTGVGTSTVTDIDGTATEDHGTVLSEGAGSTGSESPGPVPSPDNSNEAISRLRKQLEDAGISPEA